ncbi:cobalt ECF transporter T component CbiQ [Solirubrobacter soli]|uniref:cobalt ECF transporter T component CbiQ n=1 Tax=Solirubrobacter soli TaxID=363832 RepID=UPI00041C9303|nr:cobalt ECF transporter T component CbiQ [Solirubrobacter soli]
MSGAHLHTGVVGDSPVHRLDPRAKLLGLLGITVVAVSAPLHAWPVFVACAAAQLSIAIAAHIPARTIVSRTRVVLPLILFVALFIPFSEHGLSTFVNTGSKALIGTTSAVLLGATTSFPDVLHALERLRAPKLLVLIAAFMYRYLFTILDEVQRMRSALAARGYAPRHALQAQAIGRVATALFLRTYERAERVHLAMLARGWRQTMPRLNTLAFTRTDTLFLTALATPLLATRILL